MDGIFIMIIVFVVMIFSAVIILYRKYVNSKSVEPEIPKKNTESSESCVSIKINKNIRTNNNGKSSETTSTMHNFNSSSFNLFQIKQSSHVSPKFNRVCMVNPNKLKTTHLRNIDLVKNIAIKNEQSNENNNNSIKFRRKMKNLFKTHNPLVISKI